jgi:hypothetical protein
MKYKETMSGEGHIFNTRKEAEAFIVEISGFYEGLVAESELPRLYYRFIIEVPNNRI